jgi:hypothetical protein
MGMRWIGHVAHMGEIKAYKIILVRKPEEKISLGRPRHGWKNNVKTDLNLYHMGAGDLNPNNMGFLARLNPGFTV